MSSLTPLQFVGDDQIRYIKFGDFKMQRNGCRMECQSGDECCVECREDSLAELTGDELLMAMIGLHK